MARIPPIKRLMSEDFKDQTSWIGKLLTPLNMFMTGVVAALNHGITFADNMAAQVKTFEFTQDTSLYPMKFLCTLPSRPLGLWVVNVQDLSGTPSTLSTAVFADWDYANGQVIINNFSGLTASKKYHICVIIIAG